MQVEFSALGEARLLEIWIAAWSRAAVETPAAQMPASLTAKNIFGSNGGITMEYKGYFGAIEFDEEAEIFHGEVINLKDVITFQSDSVEGLKREFHESVDDYLEFCRERDEEPDGEAVAFFALIVLPAFKTESAFDQ